MKAQSNRFGMQVYCRVPDCAATVEDLTVRSKMSAACECLAYMSAA